MSAYRKYCAHSNKLNLLAKTDQLGSNKFEDIPPMIVIYYVKFIQDYRPKLRY